MRNFVDAFLITFLKNTFLYVNQILHKNHSRPLLHRHYHLFFSIRSILWTNSIATSLLHCSFRDWRRRSMTQVESIPGATGNESVVVKRNGLRVISIHCYFLWFPSIGSTPVQIQIADLMRTWTVYLIRIRRASLECSRRWIIYPWSINLIAISIAKSETDLISGVSRWRAACLYGYCVRTARPVLMLGFTELEGFESLRLIEDWIGFWKGSEDGNYKNWN